MVIAHRLPLLQLPLLINAYYYIIYLYKCLTAPFVGRFFYFTFGRLLKAVC